MINKKTFYSPEEVKEILSLSRNTVYSAIKKGDIPSVRVGKKFLIPVGDFDKKFSLSN